MMKPMVALSIVAGMLLTVESYADCTEPKSVAVPDGATATTDEMVAGQKAVKQYIADGQAFLDCMSALEADTAETASEEEKIANVDRYNAVVGKMQTMGSDFNAQVKAYKAAQAEKN